VKSQPVILKLINVIMSVKQNAGLGNTALKIKNVKQMKKIIFVTQIVIAKMVKSVIPNYINVFMMDVSLNVRVGKLVTVKEFAK